MYIDPNIALPAALLGASIVSLWLPEPSWRWWQLWPAPFTFACLFGALNGLLDWRAFVAMLGFVGLARGAKDGGPRWLRNLLLVLTGLMALLLALHRIPGFHNPVLFSNVRFSAGAPPVTLYANFDTALAGIVLLAVFCERIRHAADWSAMLRRCWPVTLATLVAVLALGWSGAYVRPDVKWTPYSAVFLAANLLVTCVTEEAFFRGFILGQLRQGLADTRWGTAVAVAVSTLLFGLAHAGGGPALVVLAMVAGFGYALAYLRSGRIEGAILTHFMLNAAHFVGFTYPALAA